ncbi:RHS repeat-associated core domain-containing protein [Kribbella sp. NPDC023855]|uniref:RHS repeat-associated core domain-containing protein n=1 Tax=Kribbella sp. NPDC023855 TaxID=3154698 RepID=UPI0033F2D0A9
MTDVTGQTTSAYRYTAYGQADKVGTTGEDAMTGNPTADADVVNPYRFNSSRFNGATGTYDMGFRECNPGLNRFLSRDMYAGALPDIALGSDPWNTNRYGFAGGNPISRVETGGHINKALGPDGNGNLPVSVTNPPVVEEIGNREVSSQKQTTYQKAYDETKAKLIGSKGGQGQEYMIGCNSTRTWTVKAGRSTTCGVSDVWFADRFADELNLFLEWRTSDLDPEEESELVDDAVNDEFWSSVRAAADGLVLLCERWAHGAYGCRWFRVTAGNVAEVAQAERPRSLLCVVANPDLRLDAGLLDEDFTAFEAPLMPGQLSYRAYPGGPIASPKSRTGDCSSCWRMRPWVGGVPWCRIQTA